jgi:hypothetical protein
VLAIETTDAQLDAFCDWLDARPEVEISNLLRDVGASAETRCAYHLD